MGGGAQAGPRTQGKQLLLGAHSSVHTKAEVPHNVCSCHKYQNPQALPASSSEPAPRPPRPPS